MAMMRQPGLEPWAARSMALVLIVLMTKCLLTAAPLPGEKRIAWRRTISHIVSEFKQRGSTLKR
jgi:hypothetical protein